MGRELKRVPLDFDWPLNKTWAGYLNDLGDVATKCQSCGGTGCSPWARTLTNKWYGNEPFRPEDNGSVPMTPDTPKVRAFAERQIERSPEFYGRGEDAIRREAKRLADLWNGQWSHHLNPADVAALLEAGRLIDFTHDWTRDGGWKPKSPPVVPTPEQVNAWSIGGLGHDSVNQWACVKAACLRDGVPLLCAVCDGAGERWPSPEAKAASEAWERTEPPAGAGYQIWETVSEGSPISPVFATARGLAEHMAGTRWGADRGSSVETWLAFIEGPGWAPSMAMTPKGLVSGVEAVTHER